MQKKLIALAVAAVTSGAAFAQTNVVISGNMDLSVTNNRNQYQAAAAAGSASNTVTLNSMATANSSSTSNVTLTVTEDLGNGLKAKVYIETDPNFGNAAGSAFSNAPNWIELSGNFGAVSLGYINNFALTAATTAQPFGTALGGGYSGAFGRLDGAGTNTTTGAYAAATTAQTAAGASGARDVRANNSIQYVSPNLNGFTVGLQYSAKNNTAASFAGHTQLGLNYANGPIKVAYANSQIAADALAVASHTAGIATLAGNKVTHNLLGANFTMGLATIYGGWTSSKNTNSGVGIDSNSWNIALKYAFTGALSGAINHVRVNDKSVTDKDRQLTGLGLDYAMSKRTTAYVRAETGDNDKSAATVLLANGANQGNFSRYALGLRHSF